MQLSDSDIAEEKSIVEEEWRANRGARQRFSDKHIEVRAPYAYSRVVGSVLEAD